MSVLTRNHGLRHIAVVLLTVLTLGGVTLITTPAEARVFVGIGVPLPVWGYYTPYYPYGYYVYPVYGYPGGVFIGGTFGPRRYYYHPYHHHHWR